MDKPGSRVRSGGAVHWKELVGGSCLLPALGAVSCSLFRNLNKHCHKKQVSVPIAPQELSCPHEQELTSVFQPQFYLPAGHALCRPDSELHLSSDPGQPLPPPALLTARGRTGTSAHPAHMWGTIQGALLSSFPPTLHPSQRPFHPLIFFR